MANKLKADKTYKDKRGVIYDSPYMIIDDTHGTSTPTQSFVFKIKIYASETHKTENYEPIFEWQYTMSVPDIVTYLATPQSAASSESPLNFARKHVYRYLGTELPETPTITWSDWKSDEVDGVPQTRPGRI